MNNDAIRQMRQITDQEHEESSEGTEGTTKTYNNHSEKINVSLEKQSPDEYDYDYHLFKSEYLEQIEFSKMDNNTFNFTENEVPEESGEDALKKIINFKMPRNCTREELTEFGARALECLAFDYKHTKDKKNLNRILYRTWIILRIWICIYLCIAILCWCQKGWCCCCFNCASCDPMDKILTAKKYYAENPPGILTKYADSNVAKDAKTTEFEPTLFELEAYEKFESAIRNL
ncbi:uncharacterized protein LOC125500153 [Athalia rosae]|uniref:uncharacterized protein LOC125500153 n=1 Tax=Athalia rosae TaxID=37344 RepID=UPI002033A516|nr:uncharacterized protein LOC125500153 [Athalia rosae]